MLGDLLEAPLQVIDVGCRWGPSTIWEPLDKHVNLIGFDPDPDECQRLQAKFGARGNARFVPRALGETNGEERLFITTDPACSSFYRPDKKAIRHRGGLSVTEEVDSRMVYLSTLDNWLDSEGEGPVDFIKIDTQGSELSVLNGAKRCLEKVRALEVEVQFNPIYRDVPLFGQVDAFLRENGFVLWRLANLAHYGLTNQASSLARVEMQFFDDLPPAEFVGRGGQLFWGDAFYVREDMAYFERSPDWNSSLRDACISGALNFWDLALNILSKTADLAPPRALSVLRNLNMA